MADISKLTQTYQQAYLSILERIAGKLERGNSTLYDAALIRDIQEILAGLNGEARAYLAEAVPAKYLTAMRKALAELGEESAETAGRPARNEASLVRVHRQAVRVLVQNAVEDITESNMRIGRYIDDLLREVSLEAITQKVATGQSVREAQNALAKRIAKEGLTPPGHMNPAAYAELVARSTTREATNTATLNTTQEAGHDLVQMSSHGSSCKICSMYEGRIYSISGNHPDYPALRSTAFSEGYANIHPHCRHVLRSYRPALADNPERDKRMSNRPFEDTRSQREKRAYQKAQDKKRQQRATREQYKRYKLVFGSDMPGLASFASMKARGTEGYKELLADYRKVNAA